MGKISPAEYEAWYHTPRGKWIGAAEFRLMNAMLRPTPGSALLDAGCGAGYFSRLFASHGVRVTGLDVDFDSLEFAKGNGGEVRYVQGDVLKIPFAGGAFDNVIAVTSLCFVSDPVAALREMIRVSRGRVLLGLLNRASILCVRKSGRGGYAGARWDTEEDVKSWLGRIEGDFALTFRYAVYLPSGGFIARTVEKVVGNAAPIGGFMAALIEPHGL